jgi:hypothetical protein
MLRTATILLAFAIALRAQTAPTFRRLVGVYDAETQLPIVGAEVKDRLTGNSMQTSETGHVALVPGFVRSTGALLEIRKVGYAPLGPLVLDPTIDTTVIVVMHHVAVLPTVTSTEHFNITADAGRRGGFEARCQSKLVSCVNDSTFAANPSKKLLDFLAQTGDIRVRCGGSRSGGCDAKLRGPTGGECQPYYFVNGFRYTPTGRGPVIEQIGSDYPTVNLEGAEVYQSDQPRPLRFEGGIPPCGAIVLWTK